MILFPRATMLIIHQSTKALLNHSHDIDFRRIRPLMAVKTLAIIYQMWYNIQDTREVLYFYFRKGVTWLSLKGVIVVAAAANAVSYAAWYVTCWHKRGVDIYDVNAGTSTGKAIYLIGGCMSRTAKPFRCPRNYNFDICKSRRFFINFLHKFRMYWGYI